jgi:hypothetical protein
MNIEEIEEQIKSQQLYPLRILEYMAEDNDFTFEGTLPDFLMTAKELNLKPVFVAANTLEEEEFYYTPEKRILRQLIKNDDDDNNSSEEVYLPDKFPPLKEFLSYVGKSCAYRVGLRTDNWNLNLFIEEDWWEELTALLFDARKQLDENYQSESLMRHQNNLEKQKAKEKEILSKLEGLLDDSDFTKLTTQRAMQAYVLEKIPDISSIMGTTDLRNKIAELSDQIKLKGLGRKST